jgi:hypothetical protein
MKRTAFIASLRQTIAFHMILPVFSLVILAFFIFQVDMAGCLFPTQLGDTDNASEVYASSSYVSCSPETLYYSGYDYIMGNHVLGHYYYTLVNGRCTFYLLSASYVNQTAGSPVTLHNASFRAKLETNTAFLQDIISLMAGDLNWTASGLGSHVSSIFVCELHYSPVGVVVVTALLLLICICALVHLAVLSHDLVHPLNAVSLTHGLPKRQPPILARVCGQLDTAASIGDGICVTDEYLVHSLLHHIHVFPLESISSMAYYVSMQGLPMRRHMAASIRLGLTGGGHAQLHRISPETADILADILEDMGIETKKA